MTAIITAIIGLVSATLSGGLTYIFTREKNKAETVSIELENAQEVIEMWKDLFKEQSEKITKLETQVKDLQKALRNLKNEYANKCNSCVYKLNFNKRR